MVLKMLKANQPLELIKEFSNFSVEKIAGIGKSKEITVAM